MGIAASPILCTPPFGLLLPVTADILSVRYIITPDGRFVNMKIPVLRDLSGETVNVEQGQERTENLSDENTRERFF